MKTLVKTEEVKTCLDSVLAMLDHWQTDHKKLVKENERLLEENMRLAIENRQLQKNLPRQPAPVSKGIPPVFLYFQSLSENGTKQFAQTITHMFKGINILPLSRLDQIQRQDSKIIYIADAPSGQFRGPGVDKPTLTLFEDRLASHANVFIVLAHTGDEASHLPVESETTATGEHLGSITLLYDNDPNNRDQEYEIPLTDLNQETFTRIQAWLDE